MTDVRHLRHFVAVARASSFRVAGTELGVSQSTMTKSVAALEQDVQLRLFNRTTRRVDLTDTGRELYPIAEAAVKSFDAFLNQARLLSSGEIGALRLVHDSDVISLVPQSVAERAQQAGGIEIADVDLDLSVDFILVTVAAQQPTPGLEVLDRALT